MLTTASLSTIRAPILLCLRAATDFTSVSITWVTGHVTETLPDLPYTATSVYNVNPLNVSKPSAVFLPQSFTHRQDLRQLRGSFRLDPATE